MKLTKRQALTAYVALVKSDDYDNDSEDLRSELSEFLTEETVAGDEPADDESDGWLDEDGDDCSCDDCSECSGCETDDDDDDDEKEGDEDYFTPATPARYNVVSSTQLVALKPLKVTTAASAGWDCKLSFSADEDGVYALNDGDANDEAISKIAVSVADKQIEIRLQAGWEVYKFAKLPKAWSELLVANTSEYTVFGVQNDEEDEDE